jgi:hypothetical protein
MHGSGIDENVFQLDVVFPPLRRRPVVNAACSRDFAALLHLHSFTDRPGRTRALVAERVASDAVNGSNCLRSPTPAPFSFDRRRFSRAVHDL